MTRDFQAIGRKKQQVGSQFEDWINSQHEAAKFLGILAHVEKTEAHAKVIHGRLTYTESGVADYIGTLEGGRSLAVEAKSSGAGRLLRSIVKSKQAKHLEAVQRAGGLALLLVEFRFAEVRFERFALPWLAVPWKTLRSAESVDADDLKGWEVIEGSYLKKFHGGGPRSSAHLDRKRVFPRE